MFLKHFCSYSCYHFCDTLILLLVGLTFNVFILVNKKDLTLTLILGTNVLKTA